MAKPPRNNPITTSQIAARAGVSRTTVSFALRNHPKIPPATAARVKAAAQELGYRPNPRVAAIMAHIRRSRAMPSGERIAFLWVHTPKEESVSDSFLQQVFVGAKTRAESLGYGLESFWTSEPGMTGARLSRILKTRGIVGIVLSPVMHESEVSLDLDWSSFAPAVIGNARWSPELHHAGHHHYLAMRMVLERLTNAGYRRPLAILSPDINERARRAWQAAFTVFHPTPSAVRRLLWLEIPADRRAVTQAVARAEPDSIIMSDYTIVAHVRSMAIGALRGLPMITLHWVPDMPEIGGVDQSYGMIAANAVDLVVNQLNSNETGVPAWPRMLLFPGRWVDPVVTSVPRQSASQRNRGSRVRVRP